MRAKAEEAKCCVEEREYLGKFSAKELIARIICVHIRRSFEEEARDGKPDAL